MQKCQNASRRQRDFPRDRRRNGVPRFVVRSAISPIDSMYLVVNISLRTSKKGLGRVIMSRIQLFLCVGALLALPCFGLANNLSDNPPQRSVQALSFDLEDRGQARGFETVFGASAPADLSAAPEDDEYGIYERFADQIEDMLAAGKAVDPASDRLSWAVMLIAFAGMTAAASGRRRARRATISI
jgi:hypothetical protein